MHAEYLGKTKEERAKIAENNIYVMIKEILDVAGLKHKASSLTMVFSDTLEEKENSNVRISLDRFQGMDRVRDKEHLESIVQDISLVEIIGMQKGVDVVSELLDACVKAKVSEGVPDELRGIFNAFIDLGRKDKGGGNDSDDDFLGGLKKFL